MNRKYVATNGTYNNSYLIIFVLNAVRLKCAFVAKKKWENIGGITKYAGGLDKGKFLNVYRKIPVFLGKDNKKFQISKVAHDARNREYIGVVDWLGNAGIINVRYCMEQPELLVKGNYNPDNYKIYLQIQACS